MVCNPTAPLCGSCNSSSPCYTATLGCMGCQKLLCVKLRNADVLLRTKLQS